METVQDLAKKFLSHPSLDAGIVLTHEKTGGMMRCFKGDLENIVRLYGIGIVQLHMKTGIPLDVLDKDFCAEIHAICQNVKGQMKNQPPEDCE